MMANPHRGEVSVRLFAPDHPDGQDYLLRPTYSALAEMETIMAMPIGSVIGEVTRCNLKAIADALRVLVTAGGVAVSRDRAVELVEHTGVMHVRIALQQAFEGAMTAGRPLPKGWAAKIRTI